ncbi:MAG: glycosyltransferase [Flavobacteriaceae bacterium]|jgi:GT2 family glycosyltransferase|nr:glycosyltransferase [Flavobacteriaceae bacterium]
MFRNFFTKRKRINNLKNNRIKIKVNQYDIDFFNTNLINFVQKKNPKVSIIIPVYNQIKFTLNCLYSIQNNIENIDTEIIVINDNSTDETLKYLEKIQGIQIITNQENKGFLLNVNEGIKKAKGEYIYLLNNDTEVQSGFLSSLLNVFNSKKDVGAVGSMLIFPDGLLQEAGCKIYKNCIIRSIGRFCSADFPMYNYFRKVSYCSGCSLLFKRVNKSGELNLLDEIYAPAYYEETDLCMRLKYEQGLNVYYQPESRIVHFESISYSGKDLESTKNYLMKKNEKIFLDRWGDKFSETFENDSQDEKIDPNKPSVLLLEEVIPTFDHDPEANRFTEIVRNLIEHDIKVYLALSRFDQGYAPSYVSHFENMGVQVIREYINHKNKIVSEKKQIKTLSSTIDYVWIFRPTGFKYWYPVIKKHKFHAKVIYDMVDLHHLWFEKEGESQKITNKQKKKNLKMKKLEYSIMQKADKVVAINNTEKDIIINNGIEEDKILVINNIHSMKRIVPENSFS